MIVIAEKEYTSEGGEKRVVGYNYNRWPRQRTEEPITLELPYKSVEDIGDIFLYLCPDKGGIGGLFKRKSEAAVGKPVAYAKLKAKDFIDPNPELKWIELQIEPITNEIKSPELAGVVGFRMTLVPESANVDFSQ